MELKVKKINVGEVINIKKIYQENNMKDTYLMTIGYMILLETQ